MKLLNYLLLFTTIGLLSNVIVSGQPFTKDAIDLTKVIVKEALSDFEKNNGIVLRALPKATALTTLLGTVGYAADLLPKEVAIVVAAAPIALSIFGFSITYLTGPSPYTWKPQGNGWVEYDSGREHLLPFVGYYSSLQEWTHKTDDQKKEIIAKQLNNDLALLENVEK